MDYSAFLAKLGSYLATFFSVTLTSPGVNQERSEKEEKLVDKPKTIRRH